MENRWRYLLLICCVIVLAGPLLSPSDPMRTNANKQYLAPSGEHLLGTDLLGRDVFSRFLHGGPRTLFMAVTATFTSTVVGVSLGILGSFRNIFGQSAQVLVRGILAIPSLLIALVLVANLGSGVVPIAVGVGIAQSAPMAEMTGTLVQSILARDHVAASRALGASRGWIIREHVLRGILPGAASFAAVLFGYSLLSTSGLSFLGLTGEPGVPDWGSLVYDGRLAVRTAPWIAAAPGLALALVVWIASKAADELATTPF